MRMIAGIGAGGIARRFLPLPVALAAVLALSLGASAATSPAKWVRAFWPPAKAPGVWKSV